MEEKIIEETEEVGTVEFKDVNFSFDELNISSKLSFALTLKLSVLSASLIILACNSSLSFSPSSIDSLLWFLIAFKMMVSYFSSSIKFLINLSSNRIFIPSSAWSSVL